MKRLSIEKELDLMLPATNDNNLDMFNDVLPMFFYDCGTYDRIEAIEDNQDHQYTCNLLKLNEQHRAFFKIDHTAETDPAFKVYRDVLQNSLNYPDLRDLIDNFNVYSYETFKNGKIKQGKQELKLFKFLKKYLTTEDIEKITTKRTGKTPLYLCISRNPVDFLFCSTNQSFCSCLNLRSSCENAYYMGLGGLHLDTNRVLVFVTDGKLKRDTLHGQEFKHFKYISRSWGLLTDDDMLYLENDYPHSTVNTYTLINNHVIKTTTDTHSTFKFEFLPAIDEQGSISFIYLDTVGLNISRGVAHYHHNGGMGSAWGGKNYNWEDGFNDLSCIKDLLEGSLYCYECSCRISEDDAHYANYEHYCEDCFNDHFTECEDCGEIVNRYDIFMTHNGYTICESCFGDNYFICDDCQEIFHIDEYRSTDDGHYCESCYDYNYTECADCGEAIHNDNVNEYDGDSLCEDCYDDRIEEEERKAA